MESHKDSSESPLDRFLRDWADRSGPQPLDCLDHLAFAIILESGEPVAGALNALAKLRQAFVDWNEIRVARVQELARTLADIAQPEECAGRIIDGYNDFFEKKGCLGFDFLEAGKVAEGRKLLHHLLPKIRKGAVNLLLYQFCPGAPLPLSDEGLKIARKEGLVGKNGDRGQLGRLLADEAPGEAAARIVQCLELGGTGSPYGEQMKPPAGKPKPATKKIVKKK